MKSKSAEVTGRLIEYIVNPSNSPVQERHVSSNDRIGRRYRDVAPVFSIDDDHDNVASLEVRLICFLFPYKTSKYKICDIYCNKNIYILGARR